MQIMVRVTKKTNLMDVVREKAKRGNIILMPHAVQRRFQRSISVSDIIQVLTTGWHESRKDMYQKEYSTWNYSIRGKTIDNRKLRIVVSFDANEMLVITVINLQKG
jgi:hypothetical protein